MNLLRGLFGLLIVLVALALYIPLYVVTKASQFLVWLTGRGKGKTT